MDIAKYNVVYGGGPYNLTGLAVLANALLGAGLSSGKAEENDLNQRVQNALEMTSNSYETEHGKIFALLPLDAFSVKHGGVFRFLGERGLNAAMAARVLDLRRLPQSVFNDHDKDAHILGVVNVGHYNGTSMRIVQTEWEGKRFLYTQVLRGSPPKWRRALVYELNSNLVHISTERLKKLGTIKLPEAIDL